MDVMERVREIGQDIPPLTEAELDGARQSLLREIAREERAGARRPARRRWLGGSAVVAGVAAAVLVAGAVMTPAPSESAAAAVLRQAADVTVNAVDTTLTNGQYLRIAETDTSSGHDASTGDGSAIMPVRSSLALYVPADRAMDWLLQLGSSATGPEQVRRLPGGADGVLTPQDRARGKFTTSVDVWRPFYAEMPRDPQALLDWFRARGERSQGDDWVMSMFDDPIATALMPPDLRAATFRALALIPGIEVVGRDGSLVTLRRADKTHARVKTIVVDTAAGFVRSYTEEDRDVSGSVLVSTRSISMSVVDQAPAPTS